MQCPNDETTLVMSERSGIEIDYCPDLPGRLARPRRAGQDPRAVVTQPRRAAAAPAGPVRAERDEPAAVPRRSSRATRRSARRAGSARSSTDARPGSVRRNTSRVPVEYVEVARAETERGELVLRERRTGRRTDVAGAARQRRVRDGHPRGGHASGRWRRRRWPSSTSRGPSWSAGSGSGSRCTRCWPTPGSSGRGGRDRAGARGLDARRDRAPRPGPAGRRAGDRRGGRRRRRARRGAAASRTTWCCSTSTTGRATSCTRRTPRSTAGRSSTGVRALLRPGGALAVWSAARAPELDGDPERGVRPGGGAGARRAAPGPRREYWLYVGRADMRSVRLMRAQLSLAIGPRCEAHTRQSETERHQPHRRPSGVGQRPGGAPTAPCPLPGDPPLEVGWTLGEGAGVGEGAGGGASASASAAVDGVGVGVGVDVGVGVGSGTPRSSVVSNGKSWISRGLDPRPGWPWLNAAAITCPRC